MDRDTATNFDPKEARATVARYEILLTVISDRLARQALKQEIADLRNHIRESEDGHQKQENKNFAALEHHVGIERRVAN